MDDVYRGVLFSLGGNICINLGHHLKIRRNEEDSSTRFEHSRTRTIRRSLLHQYCNRTIFCVILGHLLFIGGSIANGYALAFAPQTLLACIGSIQFVTNLFCAYFFHNAVIRYTHILGTVAVIAGGLIIVFGFSAHDQSEPSLLDLMHNYNTTSYKNYLIIVLVVTILSQIFKMCRGSSSHQSHHSSKKKITPLTSHRSWIENVIVHYGAIISGVLFSWSSAMTGTQSVVLGKSLAIIARKYMGGRISFIDPYYDFFKILFVSVIFVSWLVTQLYWLSRFNDSMHLYDPVFIAPMNQVMWITFSTIAGGIYFHEFEQASRIQWVALIGGLFLNYLGLFHLVPDSPDSNKKLSYADVSNMDLKSSMKSRKKSNKNMTKKDKTLIKNRQRTYVNNKKSNIPLIPKIKKLMYPKIKTKTNPDILTSPTHAERTPHSSITTPSNITENPISIKLNEKLKQDKPNQQETPSSVSSVTNKITHFATIAINSVKNAVSYSSIKQRENDNNENIGLNSIESTDSCKQPLLGISIDNENDIENENEIESIHDKINNDTHKTNSISPKIQVNMERKRFNFDYHSDNSSSFCSTSTSDDIVSFEDEISPRVTNAHIHQYQHDIDDNTSNSNGNNEKKNKKNQNFRHERCHDCGAEDHISWSDSGECSDSQCDCHFQRTDSGRSYHSRSFSVSHSHYRHTEHSNHSNNSNQSKSKQSKHDINQIAPISPKLPQLTPTQPQAQSHTSPQVLPQSPTQYINQYDHETNYSSATSETHNIRSKSRQRVSKSGSLSSVQTDEPSTNTNNPSIVNDLMNELNTKQVKTRMKWLMSGKGE